MKNHKKEINQYVAYYYLDFIPSPSIPHPHYLIG